MASSKQQLESRLRAHLSAATQARQSAASDSARAADRLAVRNYQQLRMAHTHREMLASPRYGAAARFFLTELYSTRDLSRRDRDIERVTSLLVKFLPERALATLCAALEMDALSESLDAAVAASARSLQADRRPLRMDAALYAEAYRLTGRFSERERQLALVEHIGNSLETLARMPLLTSLLRLMRGPAVAAGVGTLHKFLEDGYRAFVSMKGAREFIDNVVSRERAEHERLAATKSS